MKKVKKQNNPIFDEFMMNVDVVITFFKTLNS